MSFDVSGAVEVIGAALVAAMWAFRGWRNLQDGGAAGVTNFHWDQREGEFYEQFYERNSRRDAGAVTLEDIAGYFVLIALLGAGWILLCGSGDD